jgi:exosome complex component CSL4
MSTLRVAKAGDVVTPGVAVGSLSTQRAGRGVSADGDALRATLVGVLSVNGDDRTVSVAHARGRDAVVALPDVGALVTARVVKVNPRQAHCEILIASGVPLRDDFKGVVRQQDVRQSEVDKVEIYRCFRPGDVILAEVISLGDRHSYYLSTAKNELGVVHAQSAVGEAMLPVSWEEMQCPKSKVREPRKVAKVTNPAQ